ncbi:MAG: hydrogen peroxide-dependent heme synthase [Bryobacteraceae bacterium]
MSHAWRADNAPASTETERQAPWSQLPAAPLTLEGAAVLHQVMRLRLREWRELPAARRSAMAEAAAAWLADAEARQDGQSAVYSLVGDKGDLLWVHFRPDFRELHRAQQEMAALELRDWLEPVWSLVSVVELGLYESTVKLWQELAARGVAPHSAEWEAEVGQVLERQRKAMLPRLYPRLPDGDWICVYPMNRRRGESKNFYRAPMPARRTMMREHGETGRRYAERVRQIISACTGLDDWEWAVDLFAADPVDFKKLVYEMRFDEASADYAEFGPFYIGLRCPASELPRWLASRVP